MTTESDRPAGLGLSEGLGPRGMLYRDRVFNRLVPPIPTKARLACADIAAEADAEIERLAAALKKANDQAEHFERLWYLTNEDAARYAFAKTLEGQVVTMETFKVRGAAELDQALDDAMMEEAEAHGEPQSAVAAAYGGLVQTPQG